MAPQAVVASCAGDTVFHKTKLCKFFEEGACARGDACSFAHSRHDLQSCPNLHKTRFCSAFRRHGYCRDGAYCKYAHGVADLKTNAQHDLPKPIGLLGRLGSVADMAVPVPVLVPVMVPISISKPIIRDPMFGTSAWPPQSMTIITGKEKWTCPVMEGDPGTPSTTCASPFVSEENHAFDATSMISTETWDRQVSVASSDRISSENRCKQAKEQAVNINHDESHMPKIEFHKPDSVNRDPMQEAGSPETDVALNIALQETKLCSFYQKGFCKTGRSCTFAHEPEKLRPRPNLFRTSICFAFSRGRCKRGNTCKFAHGPEQLQGNSVQNFDHRSEPQVSHFDMAEQGESNTKTMQSKIVRTFIGLSSSTVTDVGIALGLPVTVKNTFIHFNVCKLDGRRRSVSCER